MVDLASDTPSIFFRFSTFVGLVQDEECNNTDIPKILLPNAFQQLGEALEMLPQLSCPTLPTEAGKGFVTWLATSPGCTTCLHAGFTLSGPSPPGSYWLPRQLEEFPSHQLPSVQQSAACHTEQSGKEGAKFSGSSSTPLIGIIVTRAKVITSLIFPIIHKNPANPLILPSVFKPYSGT